MSEKSSAQDLSTAHVETLKCRAVKFKFMKLVLIGEFWSGTHATVLVPQAKDTSISHPGNKVQNFSMTS